MRRVNPFLFILCALLHGPLRPAPADTQPVTELDPFTVQASVMDGRADLLRTGSEQIDPQSLPNQSAATLAELLENRPGVSGSYFGAAANRPVLRGLSGRRVGIYQSGMNTGDLSAASPDHAVTIEPLFIRKATLRKGSAALLYGGEAIGGAVDVQPDFLPLPTHRNQTSGEAGLHYGTAAHSRAGYLRAGHGGDHWALRINALSRAGNDITIPGYARTPDYDVNNRIRLPPEVQGQVAPNPYQSIPNTFLRTDTFALGAAHFRGDRSTALTYQNYQSRYGVPLDGHTHGNPPGIPVAVGPSPADGVEIDLHQHHFAFQFASPLHEAIPGHLRIKAGVADFAQQEWEGAFISNDFWRQTREAHFLHSVSHQRWRSFVGLAAVHRNYRNRNTTYAAGRADVDTLRTRAYHTAFFTLQEFHADSWTARMGLRTERQTAERTDRDDFRRRHNATSLTAEWEWRPFTALTLTLGAHMARRNPTPAELFIEAPHGSTGVFALPDPNLATERSRGAELTVHLQQKRWTLRLNLYQRRFDGFIFQQNQGYEVDGLTAYAFVQQDASFRGAELDLSTTLWRNPQGRLTGHVFADWMHADRLPEKQPLPRIPPARVGASLQAGFTRWQFGMEILHAFAQDRVPPAVFGTLRYQSPTAAHTLLAAHIRHNFTLFRLPAEVSCRITNLLDQEARQHTSFLKDVAPLPGRDVRLSIEIAF